MAFAVRSKLGIRFITINISGALVAALALAFLLFFIVDVSFIFNMTMSPCPKAGFLG